MSSYFKLRLTGRQHAALYKHLFPGDNKEAVAIATCGISQLPENEDVYQVVCVNKVNPIPYDKCIERSSTRVSWDTEELPELLKEAGKRGQVLLKIHSHPTSNDSFSLFDDDSDRELFKSAAGWLDAEYPGISAIMYSDGSIVARAVKHDGEFIDGALVAVAGDDIKFWHREDESIEDVPEHAIRTIQVFGQGTTKMLSRLTVGIVGASGTGSPVIEMLYRLGIGKLVLVDGDIIKDINVGRIYNSTMRDALEKREKVRVMEEAAERSGLPTRVVPIAKDVFNPEVVRQLAQCDIIFGCIDSVDGRDLLNRLATFYTIPYFDLGVRLIADGRGGVDQVCGKVNYLQPDGSSLLSRGLYTVDDLNSSSLRRTNPEQYKELVQSKYIKGINEDSPAVISVNTLIASIAVNDFLARIHPFREEPNHEFASFGISLTQTRLILEKEGDPCQVLLRHVGRGDISPLLDMPALSE